jgi:hypothetical protein
MKEMVEMEKREFKMGVDFGTAAKPTFFERALGIFRGRTTDLSHSSLASLGSERKALETHSIEVERRRSMATDYNRHNILR